MTDLGRINIRDDGHVRILEIDRPAKLNGFTPEMIDALAEALTAYDADDSARCALVCAAGSHFTAGLDLPRMAPRLAAGGPLSSAQLVDPLMNRGPWRRKPVVAAVQGICFTVGIELMLACDVVVAASDCRFGQIEVQRGLMASGGATIRFLDRAGWGNAMRYLLTGDEFDAATALRLGFVQEVVAPEALRTHATGLAQRIAAQAPLAVQATLENAHLATWTGVAAASARLDATMARLLATEDGHEGIRSFREKRAGVFSGR